MGKSGKISSREKLSLRESDDLFSEISWLESSLSFLKTSPGRFFFFFSLFHTNVVKHEKEGQWKLILKQLDAQLLTRNKTKLFSSLFISVGYQLVYPNHHLPVQRNE